MVNLLGALHDKATFLPAAPSVQPHPKKIILALVGLDVLAQLGWEDLPALNFAGELVPLLLVRFA